MPSDYQKPVTIYTVAERAGVSIATVSRVLQGSTPTSAATRQKVLDAVDELGYVPLRAGRSTGMRLETHGVVLHSLGGPYYSELLIGYESTASNYGQSVTVMSTESAADLDDRVRDLATKVDGMVIGHATVSDALVREISRRIPVVLLARAPLDGCDQVSVDNMTPTRELTAHVIGHGRRRLRFVGDPSSSRDVERRYAGFLQALSEAGLQDESGPYRVPYVESSGREVAADIIAQPGAVDALVCANDELALSIALQLMARGVAVPGDVAVTGWDDIMTARYTVPGLTTVQQPTRELGRLLSQLLHDRISGGAVREPIKLSSHIVIRGTCGCPEDE